MTANGSGFLLAALGVCFMASCTMAQSNVGPLKECEINKPGKLQFSFANCAVRNFSAHLPVPAGAISLYAHNLRVIDMVGCVRWLGSIYQMSEIEFKGNDSSFLDCLSRFRSPLPMTRSKDLSPTLHIGDTSLPLDNWIEAMFKTLFGKTMYWDSVVISKAPLVTRVPKAFGYGDQGVINVRKLDIRFTGISAIREHDLDRYRFTSLSNYSGPGLDLYWNRICFVELAAFRNAPHYIKLAGNPIKLFGNFDWTQLAKRYPNATALATNPACANALNTADYQVIDTSYKGFTIMQRVIDNAATTPK